MPKNHALELYKLARHEQRARFRLFRENDLTLFWLSAGGLTVAIFIIAYVCFAAIELLDTIIVIPRP